MTYHPFSSPSKIASTDEFKDLVLASGLQTIQLEYQVLKKPHPATLIGIGKIQELKQKLVEQKADCIVFDCPLSGVQIRNLSQEWQAVRVLDRHQLILDIFAQRATTYEGKLQVQLARYLDEMPRMVGAWMSSLSRQGGGIGAKGGLGAKGPGEKALERDRRVIQLRVKKLRQRLEKVRLARNFRRKKRQRNKIPSIALIGYTNSGKSTLMNALTQSKVPVKSLAFMTLDPITRQIYLPNISKAVITDTVGFIQNLSPHLIEAFKATLEESADADILLHVIDLSSPLMKQQIETVNQLLDELNWDQKPCLHIYNKMDQAPKEKAFQVNVYPKVFVSAKTGLGLNTLRQKIADLIMRQHTESVELYFPKRDEKYIYSLDRIATICRKESSSLGTLCYVHIQASQLAEWKQFLVKKTF